MIVDFDDFAEDEHRLDLLHELHDANPAFRCTLFAIPAKGSDEFWESVPDWCELAVHGWEHPHSREAENWTVDDTTLVFSRAHPRFVPGFKAPGWQISYGSYVAALRFGWWVADHWDNDRRRPENLLSHVVTRAACEGLDPEHWHGHIPNVCGNGIEETFPQLLDRVENTDVFELISERVTPWKPLVTA